MGGCCGGSDERQFVGDEPKGRYDQVSDDDDYEADSVSSNNNNNINNNNNKKPVVLIEFNEESIIQHIIALQPFHFSRAWATADLDGRKSIEIESQLPLVFLYFIQSYIEEREKGKAYYKNHAEIRQKSQDLAQSLKNHYLSILRNYGKSNETTLTQTDYRNFFVDYLHDPNPETAATVVVTEYVPEPEPELELVPEPEEEPALVPVPVPVPEPEPEEEPNEVPYAQPTYSYTAKVFNMLEYISTSPTILGDPSFSLKYVLPLLKIALENRTIARTERSNKCGEILCALTEEQRVEVCSSYVGTDGESLLDMVNKIFSSNTKKILVQLCQSRAENDAIAIQRCISKSNSDHVTVNQILMSSTNAHLQAISQAYERKFGGLMLDEIKGALGKKNGTYHQLMTGVLGGFRAEYDPIEVVRNDARKNARTLYQLLEKSKKQTASTDKLKVVQIFVHQSWAHVAEICKHYSQLSGFDIRTQIEKQLGNRSSHALCVVIDVSRSRTAFFAKLLEVSMKGLGTKDELLVRVVVGRSGIDLTEICDVFSRKYAAGKTLLQWINDDTSGPYCTMLCRLTNIGEFQGPVMDDHHSEVKTDDNYYNNNRRTSRLHMSPTMTLSSRVDSLSEDDVLTTWNEYICSGPTVKHNSKINLQQTAADLVAVIDDKKKKKVAKKILVNVIANITWAQRKELSIGFKYQHPDGQTLEQCMIKLFKKGKTMIVLRDLMKDPAEFYASWMRQAIRNKKMDALFDIVCQCSNLELTKIMSCYAKMDNGGSNLIADVEKLFSGKNTAKMMVLTLLTEKRPENTRVDKKLMRVHVNDLASKKLTSKEKMYFAKLLVENSYPHLELLIHKFNETSEKSFPTVCKAVIGTGLSGQLAEHIIQLATNRYGYFAQKLRDSMKGMGTDDMALMRILICRCEKDLGEINRAFSEHVEYGEGKTLKQWVTENSSGSFQNILLWIAGCHDDIHDSDYDYSDSETPSVNEQPVPAVNETTIAIADGP